MDKVFQEKDLTSVTHKEFNEFTKGEGFKGQNNYKLRDLKAMFGFKPMITGSSVMISSDGAEPMRNHVKGFNFYRIHLYMLRGIPLIYAKRNSMSKA